MSEVTMCKIPFATHVFNKGQKVWVVYQTGDDAYFCAGKHRGSGRYIKAWVNWSNESRPRPDWQQIEVDDDFAARHGLA